MIAVMGVDGETGQWGARLASVEADSTFEPPEGWLEEQLEVAARFQMWRGGGMFVLSLPGV